MSVTLGSWKHGEDVQIIRHLLKFMHIEYGERIYTEVITATNEPQVMLTHKPSDDHYDREHISQTLVSMEVPFLIDQCGDLACGKTNIIYQLAKSFDLVSTKESELKKLLVEEEANKIKENFAKLNDDNEEDWNLYLKNLKNNFKELSNILRLNIWFAGENITYVDFMLYDVLKKNLASFPGLINSYVNLKYFLKRFDDFLSYKNHEEQKQYLLKLIASENIYNFKLD